MKTDHDSDLKEWHTQFRRGSLRYEYKGQQLIHFSLDFSLRKVSERSFSFFLSHPEPSWAAR
ncbi:hypothetical protein Peur_053501 [Populus x canadensis]